MDNKQFQQWLSGIDQLSPAQRQQAQAVFLGGSETATSLAAIEANVGEDRRCPHCGASGAISRGKSRGLRRYQCKACGKTFNAATGTPLSGLHRKDKWLAFGTCVAEGLTVRASAERCGLAVNTAFRWRHRFLSAQDLKTRKLTGIVEADETYVLESRKGARNLERAARRRGGKAGKRGLSDEQVPVLVAADRSGATVSTVLPAVNADTLRCAIEPVVDADIVLVTDGHRAYPPLRRSAWGSPRSVEPVQWGAGARCLSHPDGQQPTQPVEAVPASLQRRRNKVSRQLPAMVPAH